VPVWDVGGGVVAVVAVGRAVLLAVDLGVVVGVVDADVPGAAGTDVDAWVDVGGALGAVVDCSGVAS
jgi:hypothetical protein